MASIFLWWFVVLVIGLTTFPITFVSLRFFPDKGYFFSKVLGLLLLGYLSWIFGYLSFNTGTIVFSFLVLAGISGLLLWNWTGKYFLEFFKKNLGFFIVVEALLLLAFLVAGAYKMRTHDIAGTEKPMDFAMINGILASPSMPPQDPWLAGAGISYYYFGYLIVAVLCKITGVPSGEGYNLAVALIWALAAVGAFSLGHALTRRYRYGLLSAACLAIFGNMDYWHRAVQTFQTGNLSAPYYNQPVDPNAARGFAGAFDFLFSPLQHGWDYFQASRIIPVPPSDKMINEFPSFSFFLSDLHPHVMAIPFVLLALALAFNLIRATSPGLNVFGGQRPWQLMQWVLLALVFGASAFLNSWDFPSLMFILGLCLFLQQWWSNEPKLSVWFKAVSKVGIPIVIGAFLLYFPFYLRFQSQAQGVGISTDRTDLYYLCVIFGTFLTVLIPALVGKALGKTERGPRLKPKKGDELECAVCGKTNSGKKFCGFCGGELALPANAEITPFPDESSRNFFTKIGGWLSGGTDPINGWLVAGGLVLAVLLLNFAPVKMSTVFIALFAILLCLIVLAAKSESKEMVFATLLIMTGFLLVFGCEVFYLRDLFTGALYRMNTVFKFHYGAWILFSVAMAPFGKCLFENLWPQWVPWKKMIWTALAGFVFLGAAMYPLLAFTARMRGSATDVVTMDGAVFYEHVFPADYQMVQWIQANIKPVGGKVPVILEAWGGSYHQEYAKLATNTGYPTVLGWDFHEVQWRGSGDKAVVRGENPDDTIVHRQADIDAIYTSPDLNLTRDLLKKYKIDYVYVGDIERQKYKDHPENLSKFGQIGPVVQAYGNSVLYKVGP